MKHLSLFFAVLFLFGCGRKTIYQAERLPLDITDEVKVPIDTTVIIPATENSGEGVWTWEVDESKVWDWGDATTEVQLEKNEDAKKVNLKVKTTVKERIVRIVDTMTVEVTLRDTVTIETKCPDMGIPSAPAAGAGLFDWLWWAVTVVAVFVTAFMARRRKPS